MRHVHRKQMVCVMCRRQHSVKCWMTPSSALPVHRQRVLRESQRVQTGRCITWLPALSAFSVMCVYEVRDDNDCGVGINININTWWWSASSTSGALYSTVTAWIHHPGSVFWYKRISRNIHLLYTCRHGLWWLGKSFGYIVMNNSTPYMIRSYHPEYTRSRPISEVKLDWAGPVLWTEMTREAPVTNLLLGVLNNLLFFYFHSSWGPEKKRPGAAITRTIHFFTTV